MKRQNGLKNTENLLISVIIPAYNAEKDIAACLDSVLAQENVRLEIITVENGSEDGTREIIRAYAEMHPEIKPIYLDKNCGPAGARNPALDQAKGDFVAFCDSDDQVPLGAYEELVRVAEQENADIVTGNYSRKYPREHNAIRQFSHYQARTGFERCFEAGNTTLWNKIYRRSFIEKHHLRFDTNLRYHEDFHLYLRFMLNNPIAAFTDSSVYIYTEPTMRTDINDGEIIRYASLEVIEASMYVCRDIFQKPIQFHENIWAECLYHHVNWLLQCVWCNIMDADERREGFEIIRGALCDLQKNQAVRAWSNSDNAQKFFNAIGVDIHTLNSISCEDYLFLWARKQNLCYREPDNDVCKQIQKLTLLQREEFLNDSIQNIMDNARKTYQAEFRSGKKVWRQNFWNLVDAMVNDYWRLLVSRSLKEQRFNEIKLFLVEMAHANRLCKLENEQIIWRFKEIFGVDQATLQQFSLSQYLLLCETNKQVIRSGNFAPTENIVNPLIAYVSACRNGQLGMRGILKGIIAWIKYKIHR